MELKYKFYAFKSTKDSFFAFNSPEIIFLEKKVKKEEKGNGDSDKRLSEFPDRALNEVSDRLLVHLHNRGYFLQTELIKEAKSDYFQLPCREPGH